MAAVSTALDLAGFTAADFHTGHFMAAGFMAMSGACTMVSAMVTAVTGTHGWHNGRYGWWWGDGLGRSYYPYDNGWYGYPDYYDYGQPYAGQTWYYCSDPAGYYSYVTQCNTGWQAVPAS